MWEWKSGREEYVLLVSDSESVKRRSGLVYEMGSKCSKPEVCVQLLVRIYGIVIKERVACSEASGNCG
jgi:hypothetical protein